MAPSRDGPSWFELFKANRALKKRVHKIKKENRRYLRDTALLLEELEDSQREKELLREKVKSLEKTLKGFKTPKMIEKSVETVDSASGKALSTDIVSPVMIHLVTFLILNTMFMSHLIEIGVRDSETMQGGIFVMSILYIMIVWYVMRAWNM